MRHLRITLMLGLAVLAAGGCATKRYGRVEPLTGIEASAYDCREIRIEAAKVVALRQAVLTSNRGDLREAAAFLGDFGIGNAIERRDALKSADARWAGLEQLWAEKRCTGAMVDPPAPAAAK